MVLGSNARGFIAHNLTIGGQMPGPGDGASRVHTKPYTGAATQADPSAPVRWLANAVLHASIHASSDKSANTRPSADQYGRYVDYNNSFDRDGHIFIGRIIDGVAPANAYIVELERANTSMIASALLPTSQSVIGATAINSYVPGTSVLVFRHPTLPQAIILGVVPYPASTGSESRHDCISQTSRSRSDESHFRYLKMARGSGIRNFSAWQPFDATTGAEWGAIASTGLQVTLDDFMVNMSVNEFTGVFGFYHDSLLRLAGYNLQTWTAGHERDAYMDQGEYNDFQGYTPYPWEQLGSLKPAQDVVKEYSAADISQPGSLPYYAYWENKYDNQQPFHRTQKFYGYYGQGSRAIVCAPPKDASWYTYKHESAGKPPPPFKTDVNNEFSSETPESEGQLKDINDEPPAPPIGLAEDNTGLDGRRFIASAKGISLVKRPLLPVPTRLRRPEDGTGDDAARNYKAAGKFGVGGMDHNITGDIQANDAHPHLQRAAGILDLHGYLFNYAGLHPFYWHVKDYKTWEQSELEHASHNQVVPIYTQLRGSMYLQEPGHVTVQVDHRYNTQKLYISESYISMLEDGGVVIGDGYGAEIRMSAGSVTISAPGDVWFKPGKNAQIWAGRDIIARSVGDIDLSTSEKSIRIKAEKNVMVLAGNDSSDSMGGVLIESRAKSPTYNFDKPGDDVVFGGVVLRAKDSEVIGLGKNIYMRTTGGYAGTGTQAGVITLDASRGSGTIMTKSKDFINHVQMSGQIIQAFGLDPMTTRSANVYKNDFSLINGPLYTDGPVVADGKDQGYSFVGRGGVYVNGGHIATMRAAEFQGQVAPCPPGSLCSDSINEGVNKIENYINSYVPREIDNIQKTAWEPLWYAENRPGNADTIKKFEFSFRTDEQYRISDFELFEDRWQQLARLSSQELDTWEEKPVAVANSEVKETWPFPGKAKLSEDKAFVMHDFSIVEYVEGGLRDKDRGADGALKPEYTAPEFKEAKRGTIVGNYKIIK